MSGNATTASVTVNILIPATGPTVAPRYVSPGTKSLLIKISLKGKIVQTVGVNLTAARNRNCKSSPGGVLCSQKLALPPAKYTASFATYSGLLAKGKPTGKELSANQKLPLKVPSKGLSITIDNSLAGIPATVAFVPSSSSPLSGSQTAGYTLSSCNALSPQQVDVYGVDAAGYEILGKGAPKVFLSSSDSSVLAVSGGTSNAFTLTVGSASLGTTVTLPASATPLTASGVRGASADIKVTFGSLGCVTYYPVPASSSQSSGSQPSGITTGPDGNVWFTEGGYPGQVGKLDPSSGSIALFSSGLPLTSLYGVTNGPNGDLWFAGWDCGCIGSVTTSGTISTVYINNTQYLGNCAPLLSDVVQESGVVWFTNPECESVGWYGPSSHIQQQFALGNGPGGTYYTNVPDWAIAAGPDGALWLTNGSVQSADSVQVVRVSQSGTITKYPLQAGGVAYAADGIAAGPDGNLWVTGNYTPSNGYYSAAFVGKLTTAGVLTPYPVDVSAKYNIAYTDSIASGSDGNLYFLAVSSGRFVDIGKVTTSGTVTLYPFPSSSNPNGDGDCGVGSALTYGSDGNLWFTDCLNNSIDRFGLH